ncbi:DUF4192 family protein [Microbacterium flavum]|uniref:DUF4192 family protein n=1 Tax=Microbacterium flavum TaxID=415216 RepID=A0ABS5XWS2_9MICO|nr:DUF4192 family protein [Microbacterium flavum]MBT8798382.1 DUF4192 family protein [Microbacterium flavum]
MSITVRAADAAQFLSLVPRLLGFTPTRSLVLVPMSGGRSLGAMRMDLPPEAGAVSAHPAPSEAPEGAAGRIDAVASSAVGMLCRIPDAEALVAVVYTDASIADAADLPGATVIAALAVKADACGLRLIDALTVAADGWASHDDPDLPPGGRPLTELRLRAPVVSGSRGAQKRSRSGLGTGDPVAEDLGPAPDGDQSSGAALPAVPRAARKAVGVALRSLGSSLEVICGIPAVGGRVGRIDPAALEAACALDDLPALYEQALTWHPSDEPMHAAMLGWCLQRPSLRDIALVQWATDEGGGDVAMEAQRRWEDGEEYPADLASVMWGEGPRPDPERIERALALVREVAALLPTAQRPGPLALCAWLSWALGRSSHADRYASMALFLDPHHGLADIVRSFAAAGHLPDWAFRMR